MRTVTVSRQGIWATITIDGKDFCGFSIDAEEMLSVVATEVLADADIHVGFWTADGEALTAEI